MSDTKAMPDPSNARNCPECGTPLPTGALAGLCPACLLQQGAAPDTVTEGRHPPFDPPPVTELALLFPQLEILELIGKGGMGAVYKARQRQLDRIVALKILPPGIGDDPAFAERFTREARALAKLNHPGIVTLYEFGVAAGVSPAVEPGFQPGGKNFATSKRVESSRVGDSSSPNPGGKMPSATSGGTPDATLAPGAQPSTLTSQPPLYFFLMEFVDGVNLRQLLHAGRVSAREALAIVPQICDALQFAHDQGIVHRDIKPENILLDRRGRVKVADFGLAKIVGMDAPLSPSLSPSDGERVAARPGEGIPALTDAGKVMGTPQYMSPEQREHPADVDHRADIYALGVVFYQMLTGELPGKPLQPPSKKVSIDVRLDEVVLRALETTPERRFQHASVMKTRVETIATSSPVGNSPMANALWLARGVDYRSEATFFGLPWLHVATGFDPVSGRKRIARGILAIGDVAQGVFAFGGLAMGGVAFGGGAIGVIACGGGAIGLLSFGGLAIALLAALGGGAMAPVAIGGGALGYFAYGGGAAGAHVLDAMTRDPVAEQFFLPWAKTLMANFQWLNAAFLVTALPIMVGVPIWFQRRAANPPRAGGGPELPPIEAAGRTASQNRQLDTTSDWPRIVRRAIKVGLLVWLLTFALATLVTFLLPKSYRAAARVLVARVDSSGNRQANGAAFYAYDPYFIQTESEIIQSQLILEPVIQQLNLEKRWSERYAAGQKLGLAETLQMLKNRLELRSVRNTALIDVGVYSEVREETAELANAIAESYVNYRSTQVRASNEQRRLGGGDADELAAAQRQFQALVVEKAIPPLHPTRPNRPLNIFLGAVAGVFLGGIAAFIAGLVAWGKQRRLEPAAAAPTQRDGRLAVGLFLVGTLGTLVLMTISSRHELALSFGGVSLTLALIFGVLSWRARMGKFVVITLATLVLLSVGSVIIWFAAAVPAQRAAAEQNRARMALEVAELQRKAASQSHQLGFGPPIERVVYQPGSGPTNCIDFDSGRTGELPPNRVGNYALKYDWMAQQGFDALGWRQDGLECPGMITVEAVPGDWERLPANDVVARLAAAEKLDAPALQTWGKLPTVWVFRTREGAAGLLQITGFTDNPRGVKLRYKLVRGHASTPTTTNEKFTAPLPQGQIRLLAVSQLAPASATWWLPDGAACPQTFDAEWGYARAGDSVAQLVFEKQGFPDRSAFFYKVTPASCSTRGQSSSISSAGKPLLNCEAIFIEIPKADTTNALKQFTVQAGVACGEGTVVLTNGTKGGIGASGMRLPGGASFNLMSSGPVEGNGFVSLTFSHTQLTNWDVRITALDQAGKVREPVTYGTTTVDAMAQTHARFEGLPISAVKEFRFAVRPYRWIEFRNISLQPGERTQFEIVEREQE